MSTLAKSIRRRVVRCAPMPLRTWARQAQLRRVRRRNAGRPIDAVFSEIYARGTWGDGGQGGFDSGTGSHGQVAQQYAGFVRELIQQRGIRRAVDIGCGDFRVAEQFVDCLDSYNGIDVVPDLVARNEARYGRPGVHFWQLDASQQEPPEADVCLIRQVLQHLSNAQIAAILRHCRKYPLVVVTEHWPAEDAASRPNLDKPHGPDTRLDLGSWVDITAEPFGCTKVEEVLRVPAAVQLYHPGETIRTHLWYPDGVGSPS